MSPDGEDEKGYGSHGSYGLDRIESTRRVVSGLSTPHVPSDARLF